MNVWGAGITYRPSTRLSSRLREPQDLSSLVVKLDSSDNGHDYDDNAEWCREAKLLSPAKLELLEQSSSKEHNYLCVSSTSSEPVVLQRDWTSPCDR